MTVIDHIREVLPIIASALVWLVCYSTVKNGLSALPSIAMTKIWKE